MLSSGILFVAIVLAGALGPASGLAQTPDPATATAAGGLVPSGAEASRCKCVAHDARCPPEGANRERGLE